MVTLTFAYALWGVYWGAVKVIYSMENPDQLRAFTTIFQTSFGVLGSIALGYLGFTRNSTNNLRSYVESGSSILPSRSTKDLD